MKKRFIDAAVWIAIFLCGSLLASMLAFPAFAQETGRGVVCDEAKEVEQFLTLASTQSSDEAIKQVNGSTQACAIVTVAFVRGPEVSQVRLAGGTYAIVEITIIAAYLGMGFQSIPPLKQYSAFRVQEEPA